MRYLVSEKGISQSDLYCRRVIITNLRGILRVTSGNPGDRWDKKDGHSRLTSTVTGYAKQREVI
jgi:hypothetical protein